MPKFKAKWICVLLFVLTNSAQASIWHLGASGGGHWSIVNGTTYTSFAGPPPFTLVSNSSLSSFNYALGATLAFFQDKLFSVHVVADYLNNNASSGSLSLSTQTVAASALLAIGFDLFGNRHSLGVGATYARNLNKSVSFSNLSVSDVMPGIVIQGKDMWKVGKDHNIFLASRVYIWPSTWMGSNNASVYALSGQLGFEY